ncbi:MAG: UxaA family hydrolase [Acidobacteria bacterium]|nr:UxaA family hydrolase [Acidobacteriota bacterium]
MASKIAAVVLPENAAVLNQPEFIHALLGAAPVAPTLAYGEVAACAGLHLMETPTAHPVETLTGLGATGVEVMLASVRGQPLQGHPMIPLLQFSGDPDTVSRWQEDLDAVFAGDGGDATALCRQLLDLLTRTASRAYVPRLYAQGNTDFQLTRGRLGISM